MEQKRKLIRPAKNDDIQNVAREAVSTGYYLFSAHALDRMRQRRITQMDIKDVLLKGRREKRKDEYDGQNRCWKYAWRGTDEQARLLRVIIREHAPRILIITVIDLESRP